MPNPQQPGDIRLRKNLDVELPEPRLPDGFALRAFAPGDAMALHALLVDVFDDQEPDVARWWAWLSSDAEYDPALVFMAWDANGNLVGAAQCWTSGFVKDLATAKAARGKGLGEALMRTAFATFKQRGFSQVDLKTSTIQNAAAVRLYKRLGMVVVDWDG